MWKCLHMEHFEQSKRVAYQMMAIKDLRDCGWDLALSRSGACPGLLLFIITVWLSMLSCETNRMAGHRYTALHGMSDQLTICT